MSTGHKITLGKAFKPDKSGRRVTRNLKALDASRRAKVMAKSKVKYGRKS